MIPFVPGSVSVAQPDPYSPRSSVMGTAGLNANATVTAGADQRGRRVGAAHIRASCGHSRNSQETVAFATCYKRVLARYPGQATGGQTEGTSGRFTDGRARGVGAAGGIPVCLTRPSS